MTLNSSHEKVVLDTYSFIKPKGFVECDINSKLSVKLKDLNNDCQMYISTFGRMGDYCKSDYENVINNINGDVNLRLISSNVHIINTYLVYNVVFFNKESCETIYFLCKDNKTFRISFILFSNLESCFIIVKEILMSITSLK